MHQETYELAKRVGEWHEIRWTNAAALHEAIGAGFQLKIDDDVEPTTLTEEQAKFLKLGIVAALNYFDSLPFHLEPVPDEDGTSVGEAIAEFDKAVAEGNFKVN